MCFRRKVRIYWHTFQKSRPTTKPHHWFVNHLIWMDQGPARTVPNSSNRHSHSFPIRRKRERVSFHRNEKQQQHQLFHVLIFLMHESHKRQLRCHLVKSNVWDWFPLTAYLKATPTTHSRCSGVYYPSPFPFSTLLINFKSESNKYLNALSIYHFFSLNLHAASI